MAPGALILAKNILCELGIIFVIELHKISVTKLGMKILLSNTRLDHYFHIFFVTISANEILCYS